METKAKRDGMHGEECIVIIGVQSNIGLATVWSLAKQGVKCIGVSHKANGIGLYSKHLYKGVFIPYSPSDPAGYVENISKIAARYNATGIMCHHEEQMLMLNKHSELIDKNIKLLFPPNSILNRILNKDELLSKAGKLGIKCPKSAIIRDKEDIKKAGRHFSFPAILKRAYVSSPDLPPKWQFKCKIISSAGEWLEFTKDFPDGDCEFLLQQFVLGKYISVGVAMKNGIPIAQFQWTALREHEPGLGGLRLSMPLDSKLSESAVDLCRSLKYDGVCEVEFRGFSNPDSVYLMEINPRLWGGIRLPVTCGVDFPYLGYKIYKGDCEIPPVQNYRTGIYSQNLSGDIKWLLKTLFQDDAYKENPNLRYSKKTALVDFAKNLHSVSVYDLESLTDIAPCLKHYFHKMSNLFRFS